MKIFYYTYEAEIPYKEDFVYVELHCEMDVQDEGIYIGEILWDKDNYSPSENKVIDSFIEEQDLELRRDICKAYTIDVEEAKWL